MNTPLSPTLTVYWDYDEAQEDGLFYSASVSHTLDLTEKLQVNLGALVSYNQSSDYAIANFNDFHNYELSLGVGYAVTDQIVFSPIVLYSSGISEESKKLIDSEVLGGLSLALNF